MSMQELTDFSRFVEKMMSRPPKFLEDSEWAFVEFTNQRVIDSIAAIRRLKYREAEIAEPVDQEFDWDMPGVARHVGIVFRFNSDSEWNLAKALRLISRDNPYGILPSELNLADKINGSIANGKGISSQESKYFRKLLDSMYPENSIEVSGLISFSDVCKIGCVYRQSWSIAGEFFRQICGREDKSILLHTQNESHTKWYHKYSGLKYTFLGGDYNRPYIDYGGREAITIALDPKLFSDHYSVAASDSVIKGAIAQCEKVLFSDEDQIKVIANLMSTP